MRRFERHRVERLRRTARLIGLSFALGALADVALTWRLERSTFDAARDKLVTSDEPSGTAADEPHGVARPGEPPPVPVIGTTGAAAHASAIDDLRDRDLEFPVEGLDEEDLYDSFADRRGARRAHQAIDIMAPRHTPVRAVEDGVIAKLFNSQGGGGITIYQFDPTNTYCYYYAHLDRYARGLREGMQVRRGQVIGYVGSTGNASPDAPHLHFAIFQLTSEKRWWEGEPINPYPVFR